MKIVFIDQEQRQWEAEGFDAVPRPGDLLLWKTHTGEKRQFRTLMPMWEVLGRREQGRLRTVWVPVEELEV